MGEIKSTLDLVMKKTEHLNLSAEERQEQINIEIEKRIKGLLQKYQDQTLSKNDLDTEFTKLKKEFSFSDDTPVVNSILKELDLNKDNYKLLALLNNYCGKDSAAIESVLLLPTGWCSSEKILPKGISYRDLPWCPTCKPTTPGWQKPETFVRNLSRSWKKKRVGWRI
jgi:hypothetical protein